MGRRYVFILLCLFSTLMSVNAQYDIDVKIEKSSIERPIKEVQDDGNFCDGYMSLSSVLVKITNNNSSDIILCNYASWSGPDGLYDVNPSSYIKIIANPSSNSLRKETGKIVISKEMTEMGPGKNTMNIILKPGETHRAYYQLIGEEYGPIKSFPSTYNISNIQFVQVELNLMFYDVNTLKTYKKVFYSNVVNWKN